MTWKTFKIIYVQNVHLMSQLYTEVLSYIYVYIQNKL